MKTLDCNYAMFNPNIVASENCYVFDESGKKYVDFEAGVWALPLGHNHKQVNEALVKQLNTIGHVGYRYSAKIVDEAAEKVLGLVGFPEGKCTFLSSGSEAVEFGVGAAKKVMGKAYLLCLSNYYLSAYGISQSRNPEEWISLDCSAYLNNPGEFLQSVPFDKIGAFVFEPGNASGTVKLPPKDLIKEIERRIKEAGGLIVVDEVTTGTGRTGKWFGYEHYGIRPDIVCLGKGIGNGYPVSVVAMTKKIADLIESSDFKYAQSHQNDPLGCAVVKEVITVIENNHYIQRCADMGAALEKGLTALLRKYPFIKEVRGTGLLYVMEFSGKPKLPLEKIHKELFCTGYIVGINVAANVLRFYPPLAIEETDIESMLHALDKILRPFL